MSRIGRGIVTNVEAVSLDKSAPDVVNAVASDDARSAMRARQPRRLLSCGRLFGAIVLALWAGRPSLGAFSLLASNQLVFANVDHAPVGACSTITYGYKGPTCGVGTSSGVFPFYYSVVPIAA